MVTRKITDEGYVKLKYPMHHRADCNGYVGEHILAYEEANNCCVLKWADVHHIDDNKRNNIPSNLECMLHSKHSVLTHRKDMSKRKCWRCGRSTRLRKKKNRPNPSPDWHRYKDGFLCHSCRCLLDDHRKRKGSAYDFNIPHIIA